MELKEFITATLTEIAQGVSDAKPVYEKLGGKVNASLTSTERKDLVRVSFEVTLSDNTNSSSSKGIGVLFNVVSIGGSSSNDKQQESFTRIKFEVPVFLP